MEGAVPLGKASELEGRVAYRGEDTKVINDAVTLSGNRVSFKKSATLEDGRLAGIEIQQQTRSNLWHLGDWVLAMQERFGEEASQYVSAEHFTEAHLKRATWVCDKIEPARRVAQLSFEHHAAVAGLAEKRDQDRWLKKAATQNLAVKDLQRAMRQKKHRDRYVEKELPRGKFRVIYLDPPWNFKDSGFTTETDAYNKAERHYPTLTIDQLRELAPQIQEISARDSVMAMWCPVPLLPTGCELLAEYGFEFKTEYVWHKVSDKTGKGQNTASHYSKLEHEVLLIGTRGKMPEPGMEIAHKFPSVQAYPRPVDDNGDQIHSRKPAAYREMLDQLWPCITKTKNDRIELFAREGADGWDTWGNEQTDEEPDGKAAAANDVEPATDPKKPRLVRPPHAEAPAPAAASA